MTENVSWRRGICFKCCSSTSHVAKVCMFIVKCLECNSHGTAMQPGPETQTPRLLHRSKITAVKEKIILTLTLLELSAQVCGPSEWSRSCSKICPSMINPEGFKDTAIKVCVVLYEQSSHSLTRPAFFKIFTVLSKPLPYHLWTCSGIK